MYSDVVLLRGEDILETSFKALEKIGFEKISAEKVLVKPNITAPYPPSSGITTDINVVEAIVHVLKDIGIRDIVVGEGSVSADVLKYYRDYGYIDLAKKYGIRLLDLHRDKGILVDVPKPLSLRKICVSESSYNRFRISVAKLKTHTLAGVSLSLKNMMGVLPNRKWKLIIHADVDNRIPDLNQIVKPDFAIIDGFIANEFDEIVPNPVEMNIILAGFDPVALDTVGALCIGWKNVPHIVNSSKVGLGIADINKINVIGDSIDIVAKRLRSKPVFRNSLGKIYGNLLMMVEKIKGNL